MHEQKDLQSQSFSEFSVENKNLSENSIKFFDYLASSKEFLVAWVKTVLPRPTQPTLILSATLYFVAICSTLKRQENSNWLSLLLETKMPGLTKVYQENSWETFENITCDYINYGRNHSPIEVDMAKSRALIKLPSSWDKQVRKDFLGFFLENPNPSDISICDTLNFTKKDFSSFTNKNDILSWYRIDACTPLGNSIASIRESCVEKKHTNSNPTSQNSRMAYVQSPLSLQKKLGNQNPIFSNKNLAFDYFLPFQINRKHIYIENDLIPSKLDSAYSNSILDASDFFHLEDEKSETKAREKKEVGDILKLFQESKNPLLENTDFHDFCLQENFQNHRKQFLGKEWAHFEDALKQIFYDSGLILPSHLNNLDNGIISDKEAVNSVQSCLHDSSIKDDDIKQNLSDKIENLPFLKKLSNKLTSENINQLTEWQQLFENDFLANELLTNRFMSGYKFPEYTQKEASSLYKQSTFSRVIISPWCSFSQAQLFHSVIQTPLKIKLPPALPDCFYKQKISQVNSSLKKERNSLLNKEKHKLNQHVLPHWQPQDFTIKYRSICLEELKEVTRVFHQLGRNYNDYLNQPKDSPSAIAISPSLEDDQLLQAKKESLGNLEIDSDTKNEKSKPTQLERLQKIRERDHALEEAKKLRSFAYSNKLALYPQNLNYDLLNPKNFDINSWITAKLGYQNMVSDRKYSFLGRMNILPKRLVAKEQEDITKQILGGIATRQNLLPSHVSPQVNTKVIPLTDLQARARRDLIHFLAKPDLEARHDLGKNYRTHITDPRLRGKRLYFPNRTFFWQKRKMRSTLLGSPSRRYVVMPTISQSDWQKIIEWQLKNYFFEEDKRLEAQIKQEPQKTFKIKRINIYLPWVTLRTPLEKPFEWPLTRVDFIEDNALCLSPYLISPATLEWKSKTAFGLPQSSMLLTKMTLPEVDNSIDYWMTGRKFTLSSKKKVSSHNTPDFWSFSRNESEKVKQRQNLSAKKVVDKQFLFEPFTQYSWLLIYQLALAFFLKGTLKYLYRVQLRNFIIAICSSQLGLAITSPEFREWIHHGQPKLFYTPKKSLQDVAGSEETIPILSEIIWFLRNAGRSRNGIRGVLLAGPNGTEKISLVQAIAGEAQVPVIVQSMNALSLPSDQPYEKLENAFALARQKAPCVLFLDELDGIGKSRSSVVRNDIGASDSLFCLDVERGQTKLQFANLTEKLQKSCLLTNNSYLSSRWHPAGSLGSQVGDKEIQNSHSSGIGSEIEKKALFGGNSTQSDSEGRRINVLLRLLTEIDGVRSLNGVVVIATSQRPAMLDPALLRPGRFDTIVNVHQPNKTRRIQLFKNEIQKMGGNAYMPWDYFGIRTAHLSGSQILSAINQSAIRAILNNTVHTIETLEHGINCVTGGDTKTEQAKYVTKNDPFYISRLAFYQAGKAVVQSLLLDHPQVSFLSLTKVLHQGQTTVSQNEVAKVEQTALQGGVSYTYPEKKLGSAKNSNQNWVTSTNNTLSLNFEWKETNFIETENEELKNQPWKKINLLPTRQISSARTRLDFETRLVGLYAGKAGELLHVSGKNSNNSIFSDGQKKRAVSFLWESNLGFIELLAASSLIHLTISRWYLYSQRLLIFQSNRIIGSLNHEQLNEQSSALFQNLSRQLEYNYVKPGFWGHAMSEPGEDSSSNIESFQEKNIFSSSFVGVTATQQKRQKAYNWQEKICQEIEMSERPYGRWYRLYLPKVEESERNEEWVAPDTIFHQSDTLTDLRLNKSDKKSQLQTLNDLYLIERDSLYYTMVINCFNKAFYLLGENRELFDFFADHLMRFQILRSYEITRICSFYFQSIADKTQPADLDSIILERNMSNIINPFLSTQKKEAFLSEFFIN